MKKIISLLVLVFILALAVLPLSSCGNEVAVFGVVKNTDGENYLCGYENFSGCVVEIKKYDDVDAVVNALNTGEVEYILVDQEVATECVTDTNLKLIEYALTDEKDGSQTIVTLSSRTAFDGCTSVAEVEQQLDSMEKSTMQIEWELFYSKFVTYKGYEVALEGLGATMFIAVMGLLIGIVIGTLIALIKVIPKYHVMPRILSGICDVYVGFFRGTPMVVQLLIAWFILIPALEWNVENTLVAALVFGMNSGAYVSEIMRSGIQAVDAGQLEAARAVGLGYWTSMMKVVIPQAIKNILPTLGNEFIVLVKDTSIVSFIAVVDVTKAFRQIGDANYAYIIPYLMLALVYLVIVIIITQLIKLMERRLAKSERHS